MACTQLHWTPLPQGEYQAPTLERSPEVYYMLRALDTLGCDLFIDVHGDEQAALHCIYPPGPCQAVFFWRFPVFFYHKKTLTPLPE